MGMTSRWPQYNLEMSHGLPGLADVGLPLLLEAAQRSRVAPALLNRSCSQHQRVVVAYSSAVLHHLSEYFEVYMQ